MKFTIFKCENGFLLNIYTGKVSKSRIYLETERMTMFADIDRLLGEEPKNSTGMELEEEN